MQIGPGFRIRTAIDDAAGHGVDIPLTYYGRHFCLSYHLKGLRNTHCAGRNSHMPISQSEFGRLGKWHNRLCGRDEAPPVQEVDAGSRSQASTLYDRKISPRGSHGGRSTTGGRNAILPDPFPTRDKIRNLTVWGPGPKIFTPLTNIPTSTSYV